MAVVSLANKYRPKHLKDLVGQEIASKFLEHLIKNNLSKNIIFKGEFGTGKTTSARIYARSMLCVDRIDGLDACGKCDSCVSFDSFSNKDCLEFDAASKGSIENIRQLLDAFNMPPVFSKKKIWIIDEAHSMSPKAWDTLLKTIEEPKDFQIILFCTNYPEKIRPAIQSRCIILELKKLDIEDSKKLVKSICEKENLKIDNRSVILLSYLSKGHSRDILKNIEQLSYFGDIVESNTYKVLVDNKYNSILEIFRCLICLNFVEVIDKTFLKIYDFKKEFDILIELIIFLKSSMLYGKNLDSLSIDKVFLKEDLIKLTLDIDSFCKSSLLSVKDFFSRIDILIFKSNVSSNIEFKFLIFSICESLSKERNSINSEVLKNNKFNKRRVLNDIGNKNVNEEDILIEVEKKIEENLVEKEIPIIVENKKVYSHELYSKYKFTRKVDLTSVIYLS